MKDQSLRVLIIEDSEDDALLIIRELKKGGYNPVYERVETAAAMKKALQEKQWDIILCDYNLPKFNAPSAIAVLKDTNIDIPIIIVSGTIGEDVAVECMRLGAHDYIMKGNLPRLCPAIDRELKEKYTKEKLSFEEQRFRVFAEQSSDIIILLNREGIITYENPAVEIILGFKVEEMIGTAGFEHIHPDDFKLVTDTYNMLLSDIKAPAQRADIRFRHKDGSWRTFEVVASNLIHNNVIEAVIVNLRDITERKQEEEKLRESEASYRQLFETSPAAIYRIDYKSGKFIKANDVFCEYLGCSQEEIITISPYDILTEKSKKLFLERMEKIALGIEVPNTVEFEIVDKKGRLLSLILHTKNIYDSEGHVVAADVVAHDITERKKMEAKLRESEASYRQLFDNAPALIYRVDFKSGKFLKANDVFCEYLGCSQEEITSLNPYDILTEESKKLFLDRMEKISQGVKVPETVEYEVLDRNGKRWCLHLHNKNIYDTEGNVVASDVVAHDITERKQMEYDLRASEINFRRSLDDSPLGVRISTVEGETIYANRAILDIYGYDSIEELKNTPLKERYTPESYADFQLRKEKRLRGEFGPSEYVINIVRKNGEIRHLHVLRKEIFWNDKIQSQVIYQDITERKQAEDKLLLTLATLRESVSTTIQVMVSAVEMRDPYTAGHQKRVADLARAIATEIGLPKEKIDGIRMAGSIHDIGKISIPAELLAKPTKLTDIEFSLIKEHAKGGYEMLKNVESPWPLAQIVYQHHERMNGAGYPRNLKGDEIIIEARIMAVADVVEAMASHRPYRPGLGIEAALNEIEKNRGLFYDNDVADACLKLFREKGYQLT